MEDEPAANAGRWFTIDRAYTILEVGPDADAHLHRSVGENLWDAFPGSESYFAVAYERAWDQGCSSASVRFADNLVSIYAWRVDDDKLCVSYVPISLIGLHAALIRWEENADRESGGSPRPPLAPGLRVVPDLEPEATPHRSEPPEPPGTGSGRSVRAAGPSVFVTAIASLFA